MNFKEATQLLKKGKKIRRPIWDENSYWILGINQRINYSDGTKARIFLNQLEADDWEVVEEEKTKYRLKKGKVLTKEYLYGKYISYNDENEFNFLCKFLENLGFKNETDKSNILVYISISNYHDTFWTALRYDSYFLKFEDYFEEYTQHNSISETPIKKQNYVGTFMWAVEQMKLGKKVRRECFNKEFYLFEDYAHRIVESEKSNNGTIHSNDYIPNIEATDWEIFEENKFGDLKIHKTDVDIYVDINNFLISSKYFEDLEKAIKRARELQ